MRSIIAVEIKEGINNFLTQNQQKEKTYGSQYPENDELLESIVNASKWAYKDIIGNSFVSGKFKDEVDNSTPNSITETDGEHIIFTGVLIHSRSKVLITIARMTDSRMTIRLYNGNLGFLEEASTDVVKEILKVPGLSIIRNRIEICEKKADNVLLSGTVIPNLSSSAFKRDPKSAILAIVFTILAVLVEWISLADMSTSFISEFWIELIRKLAPSFVTTALLSYFSFGLVVMDIWNKTILWSLEDREIN